MATVISSRIVPPLGLRTSHVRLHNNFKGTAQGPAQGGGGSHGRGLLIVCRKNTHRSACSERFCGVGHQESVLAEAEAEILGFEAMPATPFPNALELTSPRGGNHGGKRSVVSAASRRHRRHGGSPTHQARGSAATKAKEAATPVPDGVLNELKRGSPPAAAQTAPEPVKDEERGQQQAALPSDGATWQDRVRGQMFWLFRTLSTVLD